MKRFTQLLRRSIAKYTLLLHPKNATSFRPPPHIAYKPANTTKITDTNYHLQKKIHPIPSHPTPSLSTTQHTKTGTLSRKNLPPTSKDAHAQPLLPLQRIPHALFIPAPPPSAQSLFLFPPQPSSAMARTRTTPPPVDLLQQRTRRRHPNLLSNLRVSTRHDRQRPMCDNTRGKMG